jgi:hypothetical protein
MFEYIKLNLSRLLHGASNILGRGGVLWITEQEHGVYFGQATKILSTIFFTFSARKML